MNDATKISEQFKRITDASWHPAYSIAAARLADADELAGGLSYLLALIAARASAEAATARLSNDDDAADEARYLEQVAGVMLKARDSLIAKGID